MLQGNDGGGGASGRFFISNPVTIEPGEDPTDEKLKDYVQCQTLKYFVDFAHPHCGMARERSDPNSPQGLDTVTTGGTGFGIMGIIAGTSRGWISREQALDQITTMVNFLEKADAPHGVFPHWLDGNTGKTFVYPGSSEDGSDLVETSFLMMGLLTARQYFSQDTPEEDYLRHKINVLWKSVNWQFHTKNGAENELYWLWSPNKQENAGFTLPIKGWNEALITHVLAASSPTYPVGTEVYHEGWATGDDFKNGKSYHGITLPLGPEYGGPLFLSEYSIIGLCPDDLEDQYAHYGLQTTNHTRINYAHSANDRDDKHPGLDHENWGHSASCNHLRNEDGKGGYLDHSPTKCVGVVAPTAALSAFPFAPDLSMSFLRNLYKNHPEAWGEFGPVDAYKPDRTYYEQEYFAINQGPIAPMIENQRTNLLWDLCMSCPEIQEGMQKLGFKSRHFEKNHLGGTNRIDDGTPDDPEQLPKPHWVRRYTTPPLIPVNVRQ